MAIFLNTIGKSSLAIGICDRCKTKYPIGDLSPDRNTPSLRVCMPCNDVKDPYRLPQRRPDDITVAFPRPDEPLEV